MIEGRPFPNLHGAAPRTPEGSLRSLAIDYSWKARFPEDTTLTALKRLFSALLAKTPWLIGFNLLAMSAFLYLDFLKRIIDKNDFAMTSDLALRLFPANIHWILSLTFPMAIGYGLIIATAHRDLSDPQARKSHVRRWLLLSLLAGPLYFLHVNLVLPEANHQAGRIRQLIIHDGDTAKIRTRRSDREMSVGQMRAGIDSASAGSPWSDKLRWEIAKKFQMSLFIPITATLALAAGLLLQRLRKKYWRLALAVILAKAYFMIFIWGMVQLEKRLDAGGFSVLLAWAPITILLLAALAGSYRLIKPRPPLLDAIS